METTQPALAAPRARPDEETPVIHYSTISRLLILQLLLVCGLGTIFLIPRETKIQPSRIRMELPDMIGGWFGRTAQVTQREHDILAKDTEFCRKVYEDGLGDQVYVSIVLSGNDLDNSIHRPERCLSAQGWTLQDSSKREIPIASAPNGTLPVTRLNLSREVDINGRIGTLYNLNYYWFIGYSDITASHIRREYIDIKDRLLHGYNQRWAYVTVTSNVYRGVEPTDQMIQSLIARIYPRIVTDAGSVNASK